MLYSYVTFAVRTFPREGVHEKTRRGTRPAGRGDRGGRGRLRRQRRAQRALSPRSAAAPSPRPPSTRSCPRPPRRRPPADLPSPRRVPPSTRASRLAWSTTSSRWSSSDQKAAELKLTVTPKEIQDRLNTIYQSYGGQKKVEALLKKQGMTLQDLQDQLKDSMLMQKVQSSVFQNVKVTPQQIQAYYKSHAQSFHQPVSRMTRHILLKTKAQAEKVRALLVANNTDANWAKLAKKYSQDAGTKNSGGDLGAVTQGQMKRRPSTRRRSRSRWARSRSPSRARTAGTSSRSPRSTRPTTSDPGQGQDASIQQAPCFRRRSRRPGRSGSTRPQRTPTSSTRRATTRSSSRPRPAPAPRRRLRLTFAEREQVGLRPGASWR